MRSLDPVSATSIGINRPIYRDLKGGVAALTELGVVWDLPTRPSMSELVAMSDRKFIAPGNWGVHYAMSAFLIRYFLEASKKGQTYLYRYLQTTAVEGKLPDPSPWSYMDMKERKFENRFRVWLRNQLFSERIMPIYTALLVDPTPYGNDGYGYGHTGETQPGYGDSTGQTSSGAGSGQAGRSGAGTPASATSKGEIEN